MEQISKPPLSLEVTETKRLQTPDYAASLEVAAALDALTEGDYLKLMMFARVHCRKRNLAERDMEPRELLNQAVLKTLECKDGKRWNKKIPLLRHLDRAMENISGHFLAELIREREKIQIFSEDMARDWADQSKSGPKDTDDEKEKVSAILKSVFGDDEQGREIFTLRALGHRPAEIQSHFAISPVEYESVNRRILRAISRFTK